MAHSPGSASDHERAHDSRAPLIATIYPAHAARRSLLLLVAISVLACGGKLAPLPAEPDAAPAPVPTPAPIPIPPPPPQVAEAGEDDAELDGPSVDADDAEITCEREKAPAVTLDEYGNLMCHALVACAGTGAPTGPQGSFGGPGGGGCVALIVGRAMYQQINPSCVNACALYLESIQQGGPGCQTLLQGGPPECASAVEPTFIYCSRSQGRVDPNQAAGLTDGVYCASDEQCVTGVVPLGCRNPPQGAAFDASCLAAENDWFCLD